MSDTNQGQSKQTFLKALVLLLVLFAGIQTWYMVGMKKQLNVIHAQSSSTQLQEPETMAIEKAIETDIVETDNAAQPVDTLQSSLQEKEMEAPVQKPAEPAAPVETEELAEPTEPAEKPGENVTPYVAPILPYDDTFNGPFETQTWSLYDEIQRMQRDMDRMFNQRYDRFDDHPGFQHHFSQNLSTPKMNVRENANQYTVYMNLPGANESDISVNLDGQRLTVKGKQDYKKQDRDAAGNMVFRERRSGRFQRSITLPKPVLQNKMKTRLDNGVLIIIIPKARYEQREYIY